MGRCDKSIQIGAAATANLVQAVFILFAHVLFTRVLFTPAAFH